MSMNSRRLASLAATCALVASAASHGYGETGGGSNGQSGAYAGSPHKPVNGSSYHDPKTATYASNGSYHNENGTPHSSNGSYHDAEGKPHAYNGSYHDKDGKPYAYNGGTNNYHASNGGQTSNGGIPANGDTAGGDGLLAHGTGVSHQAQLAGGNEVSSTGKADAGDTDGNGAASISIDPEAGKLCFALVVNNIDAPVAAHIHQGTAGRNGPVVVTLQAPSTGDPGSASGCVHNVDRALLQLIHAHPWAYYVNVHSGVYPDGAVRGQLY